MKLRGNVNAARLMQMLREALQKEQSAWRPYSYKVSVTQGVEIGANDRNKIVEWLSQLTDRFNFYPDTFVLSVYVLDRFLHTVKARPKYLRCIGITCFYLAAKMHEEDEVIPRTSELVKDSECGCTVAEVLRMERVILDKLQWDVSCVTALDFLHIFHSFLMFSNPHLLDQVCHMTSSRQLNILVSKLRVCLGYHQVAAFKPSLLAVALISMELEMFSPDWFQMTLSMQNIVQISGQDLTFCREVISRCLAQYSAKQKNRVYLFTPGLTSVPSKMSGKSKQPPSSGKRKVEKMEEDDVYSCIKRLYIEEAACDVVMKSCASEMLTDDPPPPLQPVTAN